MSNDEIYVYWYKYILNRYCLIEIEATKTNLIKPNNGMLYFILYFDFTRNNSVPE